MGKMFPFITDTWNPLKGVCPHNCNYCWAKKLIAQRPTLQQKYQGQYDFDLKQIHKKFKPGSFVFVCDMLDLFARDVPMVAVMTILKQIKAQPEVTFLLLTKHPQYMADMELPENVIAGATIESEFDPRLYGYNYSKAPMMQDRIKAMINLEHPRKFVSIEPIMDFSPGAFLSAIKNIKPQFVAVGFDNYGNNLPEPESLEKVLDFIAEIEKLGIKVYRKTIREPIDQINVNNPTKKETP